MTHYAQMLDILNANEVKFNEHKHGGEITLKIPCNETKALTFHFTDEALTAFDITER